ncbi:hypothetical protein NXS19_010000 [Fusarium pseudograminearum]|nr:hypothetical protein NXS19_010000 [Fusarium pseudograminearum]
MVASKSKLLGVYPDTNEQSDKIKLTSRTRLAIPSINTWRWDEAITTCFFPPLRAQSNVALTGLEAPPTAVLCLSTRPASPTIAEHGSLVWCIQAYILCMFVSMCLGGGRKPQ